MIPANKSHIGIANNIETIRKKTIPVIEKNNDTIFATIKKTARNIIQISTNSQNINRNLQFFFYFVSFYY